MSTLPASGPNWSLIFTKTAAAVALVSLVIAGALTSSLGMPWWLFYCTWGVMFVTAIITILGFIFCKLESEPISVFYIICPSLLIIMFLVVLNLGDIIRAILRYEGVYRYIAPSNF
jgi:hypothetical protein